MACIYVYATYLCISGLLQFAVLAYASASGACLCCCAAPAHDHEHVVMLMACHGAPPVVVLLSGPIIHPWLDCLEQGQ
jgi:hypothetical protein